MYKADFAKPSELYANYEQKSKSKINRRCIDGSITGCGNCIGYCQYSGHPGFLTSKLRTKHNCIEKGCFYYIEKPVKNKQKPVLDAEKHNLLSAARDKTASMEGIKIMDAVNMGFKEWELYYISISNAYQLHNIVDDLFNETGCIVRFIKLKYSIENCVRLIMAE